MRTLARFFLFPLLISLPLATLGAQENESMTILLPGNDRSRDEHSLYPRYRNCEPKIGLVLSGGGARGIAHIGLLKVLEENEIKVHAIVGTSMGSVVGGLYASGYSADEIWTLLSNVLWQEIVEDRPKRTSQLTSQKQAGGRQLFHFRIKDGKPYIPPAISPGQKIYDELSLFVLEAPFHAINNYDELKIPFRSIATDLVSGRKIVFGHGDLAQVMLASSAIPLLFSPVSIDSLLLVDGGVLANIPVQDVISLNPDLIIAIDTTSPLRQKDQILLPWQLADQVTTIMQEQQKETARKYADIVITPRLNGRINTDFDSLSTAYQAGYDAGLAKMKIIKNRIAHFKKTGKSTNGRLFEFNGANHLNGLQSLDKFMPAVASLMTEIEILKNLDEVYSSGVVDDIKAKIDWNDSKTTGKVHYVIKANPVLREIQFHHNHLIPDSLLNLAVRNRIGERFNIQVWQADRERILKIYRKSDFSLARIIDEKLNFESGVLELVIDEGRIESVELSGNERTRSFVILREYPLKRGEFFNNTVSREGVSYIYGTGLFDRVQPEYSWENGKLNMNIRVWEKPSPQISIGYNFSRENEFQSFTQWSDDNLFGLGNRLDLNAFLGKRRKGVNINVQSDRIFSTYLSSIFRAYYQQDRLNVYRPGGDDVGEYQDMRTGFNFSIGQHLRRAGLLQTTIRAERVELKALSGSGFSTTDENNVSIRLQWIVDSLDKLPFPTNGKYNAFFYEVTPNLFGNRENYFRLFSRFESYYTFRNRWTISPRITWATSENTTPFHEFFLLGDNETFFGFRYNELRGRRLFRTNLEIRYFMPGRLPIDTYFSLRYDWGAIWQNSADEVVWSDFIGGYGGSISFESILGVFTFSYGENSRSRREFSFNLGFDF